MIAFMTGRVAGRTATFALIDVGGIGYRLNMTTRSLAALPADGDEVTVHTHLHVREDEMTLFGFESPAERTAFEALLGVSGVGPKVALATLSALSADELAHAVATQDVALISSVPGVGKKTAQRMILDLTDKLGASALTAEGGGGTGGTGASLSEARDALIAMGFSAAEVASALKGAPGDADARTALRYALTRLGGAS